VGQTAQDTFVYTVEDDDGLRDTATVTITITGANDSPFAVNDADSTDEDTPLDLLFSELLANDGDPDQDDVLTVVDFDAGGATGGVTQVGDDRFRYDPRGRFDALQVGQTAVDQFTYTITDGRNVFAVATVTITIQGRNDPPVAQPGGPYTAPEGGSVVLDASGLLDPSGQPPGGSDLEGDDLTFAWDLDDDGIFGETGAAASRGNESLRNPAFSAAGLDGPLDFPVRLRVTDENAETSLSLTTTVRIANVAPVLLVTPGLIVRTPVGQTIAFDFRVQDAAPGDRMTYYIDWDARHDDPTPIDEVLRDQGHEIRVTHAFDEPMHYFVRVIAVDDDGGGTEGENFTPSMQPGMAPWPDAGQVAMFLNTIPVTDIYKGIITVGNGSSGSTSSGGASSGSSSSTNNNPANNPLLDATEDVNGDHRVGLDDLLLVINALRDHGLGPAPNAAMDINQDGHYTLHDALKIIQRLRRQLPAEGEAS
jgi:VCBS repeat-containing protein